MNRDDMIDVLSAVAARTTAPSATPTSKSGCKSCGDVPKEFALEAVLEHLRDKPGVWLEPGHIYQRWKATASTSSHASHAKHATPARPHSTPASSAPCTNSLKATPSPGATCSSTAADPKHPNSPCPAYGSPAAPSRKPLRQPRRQTAEAQRLHRPAPKPPRQAHERRVHRKVARLVTNAPKCQRCERDSPNGYLCPHCANHLRETLRELPWWLDRLLESAVGQVRLGDGGKRAHDPGLVKYTGQHGDERLSDDLAQGEITAAKLAATGRANAASSTLYRQAHGTLATWIRDLCESRGVTMWRRERWHGTSSARCCRPSATRSDQGRHADRHHRNPHSMALWLAQHVSTIVLREAAGELAGDIDGLRLAVPSHRYPRGYLCC